MNKSKLPPTILIVAILLATFLQPVSAQGPVLPGSGPHSSLLPFIRNAPPTYTLSGHITDYNGAPIAGVVVTEKSGRSGVTDSQGNYLLIGLPPGENEISASQSTLFFTPASRQLDISDNTAGLNFTALESCSAGLDNSGFEQDLAWQFTLSNVQASYSTTNPHTGSRSVLTGSTDPANNQYAFSDVYQDASIQANASLVKLRMYLFPVSSETISSNQAVPPGPGSLWGPPTLPHDIQYVLVINPVTSEIVETLLWWPPNNTEAWTYVEFDLTKYAGQNLRFRIGTFNDGKDGVTAMYVDDVSLEVCTGAPPPISPPPPGCFNYTNNVSFELNNAWYTPNTAYSAGYSPDQALTGARSMRTGITKSSQNKYSYSDAFQILEIPDNATAITVRMYLYPRSTQSGTVAPAELPDVGEAWIEQPLSGDAQYVFMYNTKNDKIMEYLVRWSMPRNDQNWVYKEIVLDKDLYRGKTVRLQFGSYNDGSGGITSMYADEVYVDICTDSGQPSPPPSLCAEQMVNPDFEQDKDWEIPTTAFSADYNTTLSNSGLRSMRTGIPNSAHNRFAYSDVRQRVSLPAGISSAIFTLHLYQFSEEISSTPQPGSPTAEWYSDMIYSGDVQYVFVLDQNLNWIETLLWQRKNYANWVTPQFDLTRYAGSTIFLQFGTFNDGLNGVTGMWVDNVSLLTCP